MKPMSFVWWLPLRLAIFLAIFCSKECEAPGPDALQVQSSFQSSGYKPPSLASNPLSNGPLSSMQRMPSNPNRFPSFVANINEQRSQQFVLKAGLNHGFGLGQLFPDQGGESGGDGGGKADGKHEEGEPNDKKTGKELQEETRKQVDRAKAMERFYYELLRNGEENARSVHAEHEDLKLGDEAHLQRVIHIFRHLDSKKQAEHVESAKKAAVALNVQQMVQSNRLLCALIRIVGGFMDSESMKMELERYKWKERLTLFDHYPNLEAQTASGRMAEMAEMFGEAVEFYGLINFAGLDNWQRLKVRLEEANDKHKLKDTQKFLQGLAAVLKECEESGKDHFSVEQAKMLTGLAKHCALPFSIKKPGNGGGNSDFGRFKPI